MRKNVRGLLEDVQIRVEQPEIFGPGRFIPPFKKAIEALCEQMRAVLEKADLPTDRYPVMPFEQDHGYEPLEHTTPSDEIWWHYVEESTEPLSQERMAADLLLSLLRVVKLDMPGEHLAKVYGLMQAFSLYQSATGLHELAIMGQASEGGRSQGAGARKSKTQEVRKIIWQAARAYWSEHPNYVGRRQSTAEAIMAQVNAEILARSLSSKPLTAKVIAGHIAAGLKSGNLSR